MYGVGFGSANLLKMSLVMTAAALLAIFVLSLGETTNTAEANSLPKNGKVAFASNRNPENVFAIYTVEPEGPNLNQLTRSTESESRPMWSPDGTKLTYSDPRGDVGIPVVNADGSNLRHIPPDPKLKAV